MNIHKLFPTLSQSAEADTDFVFYFFRHTKNYQLASPCFETRHELDQFGEFFGLLDSPEYTPVKFTSYITREDKEDVEAYHDRILQGREVLFWLVKLRPTHNTPASLKQLAIRLGLKGYALPVFNSDKED